MRAAPWISLGLALALMGSACATKPPATPAAAATPSPAATNESESDDDDSPTTSAASDDPEDEGAPSTGPCPADMALVTITTPSPHRFCIDKYEASLVEVLADGTERAFPHYVAVDGHDVRAVSKPHVFPQGFISEVQAQDACAASNKRLCKLEEWKTACMGPAQTTFPYGATRRPGVCHDLGKSAVGAVFGAKAIAASTPASAPPPRGAAAAPASGKRAAVTKGRAAVTTHSRAASAKTSSKSGPRVPSSSKKGARRIGKKSARPASVDPGVWARLNDPALGQVDGALAKTGEHEECVSELGVFDMVGNLHEWVQTDAAVPHGTFAGGYYLDTTLNGDGCGYKTTAHAHDYHDYSTGFRCCAAASE